MRDLFHILPADDPVESARRGARPALRRRFFRSAAAGPVGDGYQVLLDGKPVRTPARRLLAAPWLPLAEAIAAEWDAQDEVIDPAKMPLTRLANSIIDGVFDQPEAVAAEVEKYLACDLLFYRAGGPAGLVDRQRHLWDPVLTWAEDALGARFNLAEGVIHIAQPHQPLQSAAAAIPKDHWRLGATHALTTLTGSALLAIAVANGELSPDEAWQAGNVDEDWNMEQWGHDELALERRTLRHAELQAAATVLKLAH